MRSFLLSFSLTLAIYVPSSVAEDSITISPDDQNPCYVDVTLFRSSQSHTATLQIRPYQLTPGNPGSKKSQESQIRERCIVGPAPINKAITTALQDFNQANETERTPITSVSIGRLINYQWIQESLQSRNLLDIQNSELLTENLLNRGLMSPFIEPFEAAQYRLGQISCEKLMTGDNGEITDALCGLDLFSLMEYGQSFSEGSYLFPDGLALQIIDQGGHKHPFSGGPYRSWVTAYASFNGEKTEFRLYQDQETDNAPVLYSEYPWKGFLFIRQDRNLFTVMQDVPSE